MLKRAVFGAIYVAIIVAGVLCGPFALLLLLLLLSALAVNEFLTMVIPVADSPEERTVALLQRSLDCVGAAIMVVTVWTNFLFMAGIVTWLFYLIVRLSVQLWVVRQNAVESLAASFMSQLYVALPIALMSVVYHISAHLLLLLFILVWVNDTFAYLVGSRVGRHRLWERISPKKSWEGFWGGLVATVLCSAMCGLFASSYFAGYSVWKMAVIGLIVSVAGTIGDLIESMLKRTVGVKDSSHLIPGHGGILDRIDSILLVIPTVLVAMFFLAYL